MWTQWTQLTTGKGIMTRRTLTSVIMMTIVMTTAPSPGCRGRNLWRLPTLQMYLPRCHPTLSSLFSSVRHQYFRWMSLLFLPGFQLFNAHKKARKMLRDFITDILTANTFFKYSLSSLFYLLLFNSIKQQIKQCA